MRSGVTAAGALMIIIAAASIFWAPAMFETAEKGAGFAGFPFAVIVGGAIGFLGFIILIAGLAASPPREQPTQVTVQQPVKPKEKEKPKAEVLAICPECKSRIPSSTKFCPECGADLREKETKKEVSSKAETKEKAKESTAFCMYCGTELPPGSEYCPECGKEVASGDSR